jgi:hypothetical protein
MTREERHLRSLLRSAALIIGRVMKWEKLRHPDYGVVANASPGTYGWVLKMADEWLREYEADLLAARPAPAKEQK